MTCVTALGSTILSLVLTSTFIFPLLCMHVLSVHAHVLVRAADGCECVLTKGSSATLISTATCWLPLTAPNVGDGIAMEYRICPLISSLPLLLMLVLASPCNTGSVP